MAVARTLISGSSRSGVTDFASFESTSARRMGESFTLSWRVVGPSRSRGCCEDKGIRGTRTRSISSCRRRRDLGDTYALQYELSTFLHYIHASQLPSCASREGGDEPIAPNHKLLVVSNAVSLTVPSRITSSSFSCPSSPIAPHSSRSRVERQWGFGSNTFSSYAGAGTVGIALMVSCGCWWTVGAWG